jgi:hypothetical protein
MVEGLFVGPGQMVGSVPREFLSAVLPSFAAAPERAPEFRGVERDATTLRRKKRSGEAPEATKACEEGERMRFHFAALLVHGSAEVERELNVFLSSHRGGGVERHLVAECAQRAWAICVSYTDATGGGCRWRTPTGPRRASSGSGCAVERSPGLRLSASRRWAQ